MNDKEYLLRRVLKNAGVTDANVVSLVVFTDNKAKVENRFPYIKHCYLSELSHLIYEYSGDALYSGEMMEKMAESVRQARTKELYPLEIDMSRFKQDFATVVAKLENALAQKSEGEHELVAGEDIQKVTVCVQDSSVKPKNRVDIKSILESAGYMAVLAGVGFFTGRQVAKYAIGGK